jgi:hypothetical protein
MNIHFPGREGFDQHAVWIFPKVVVCFDCGLTLLTIREAELRQLEKGIAA